MKRKLLTSLFAVALLLVATPAFAATMSIYSDTSVEIVGVYNKAGGLNNYVDLSLSPLSAVRAQEPKPYPTGYVSEGPEVMNSVWDNGVAASYNFQTNAPLADWIWETEGAEGPASYDVNSPLYDADASRYGRVVVFEKEFVINGIPQDSNLRITADNGWEVLVNGVFIARSNTTVAGWETSNLFQALLTTNGWQTVGNVTIPAGNLVNGNNTIKILAGNEYYFTDDNNSPVPAYIASPYRQMNPGALIFKADINYTPVRPLLVSKTVDESYTKTWTWDIAKTADKTELLLAEGQTHEVNYEVTVTATSTNSDYGVAGVITIENPNDVPVEITSVVDSLGDVTCLEETPFVLAAGGKVDCDYIGSDLTGEETLNEVTVTTNNELFDTVATAPVDWLEAVVSEIDESVDVTDNLQGFLGTVTAANAPYTFKYTRNAEGMCDGETEEYVQTIINTASFETSDTKTKDSASHTLTVTTPCAFGCTLTQGYWKTHNDSFKGGAPTDKGWLMVGDPSAEKTFFFGTGKSWFNIFWTAPKGNVYFNLAHQYMAAKLNILNGASAPANVHTAIASAEVFFVENTPAQAGALKGAAKNTWTTLAGILGSYNEGLIGPGHCDEDSSSAK